MTHPSNYIGILWRSIFKIEQHLQHLISTKIVTHSSSRLALEHIWIQFSTASFYTCTNTMMFYVLLIHLMMLSIPKTAQCWQNLNSYSAVCLEGMRKTIKNIKTAKPHTETWTQDLSYVKEPTQNHSTIIFGTQSFLDWNML